MNAGIIRCHDLGRQQNHWLNLVVAVDFEIQITFSCFKRSAPTDVSCNIRCNFNSGAVNLAGIEYNIEQER
jgi:hypothetical protein